MSEQLQFLIAALIMGMVAFALFEARRSARQDGQANPIGTAKLQKDVNDLKHRFGVVETQLTAMRGDLDEAPTRADLEKIRGDVRVVKQEVAGVKEAVEKVDAGVIRIEQVLIRGTRR